MSTMIYNGKRVSNLAMQFLQQEQADWSQTDDTAPDYIKNKPAVDTEYSPASGNAQSGTAVAAAVSALYPPFEQSGQTVVCCPADGYPMTVTAAAGATVTQCGKNLWSTADYHSEGGTVIDVTGNVYTRIFRAEAQTGTLLSETVVADTFNGPAVFPAGVYAFSADTMTAADGTTVTPYLAVTLADGTTDTLPAGAAKAIVQPFCVRAVLCKSSVFAAGYEYTTTLQLEPYGPTAYEPYHSVSVATDENGVATVPAVGYTALFTDSGEVTVSGREDPVRALAALRQTVALLGGAPYAVSAATSEPNGGE